MRISPTRRLVALIAAGSLFAVTMGAVAAADGDLAQPIDFTHNGVDAPAPVTSAVFGSGSAEKIGTPICSTTASNAANVNVSCERNTPHNETTIAVNPVHPNNILAGANDYQLGLNPGGHVSETLRSRAHVSFDSGKTWTEYPVNSNAAYQATGDPSVAFDQTGHAYYATLGFRFVGPNNAQSPDVLVSNSGDGGRSWSTAVVARGSGVFSSVGKLNDKEYVTAWGSGNAIVTWDLFNDGTHGITKDVRIWASVTHDFGATWSSPSIISGSLTQAFVPYPTVTANNRVFVGFLNTTDLQTGRDDFEIVEVSATTGHALGAPIKIATLIDGATDYPIALGRQTYQDSLFRSWAAGSLTADPAHNGHLAAVWSDMRNSPTPANPDPYKAVTNSDVVVSQSSDYGQTWSTPVALTIPNDQFMPWGTYDTSGRLRIGTFDRSYDSANHQYGYTLATETTSGSLTFTTSQLTTQLSDPTQGDRWFAATLNPGFPRATSFIGDYSNVARDPNGGVVALWTDLREAATFAGVTRSGEDAYFAAAP